MTGRFRPFADFNDSDLTHLTRHEKRVCNVKSFCWRLAGFIVVIAAVLTFLYEMAKGVAGR